MRLLRVQVPDFRVLQNVDITFEKDFFPSIFPLGSQNGGGKSTLLQLIFGLLHCSGNPERLDFLKNLLSGFNISDKSEKRLLTTIEILDGETNVKLEFLAYKDSAIKNLLPLKIKNDNNLRFSTVDELETSKKNLNESDERDQQIEDNIQKISSYLQSNKLIYICKYSASIDGSEDEVLLCRLDSIDINQTGDFLKKLSQKIFLAAPATQVFLFLSPNSRKLLFMEQIKKSYNSYLQDAKSKLPGLFTYDFLAVDLLAKSLRAAITEDFREVTETGKYGNSYKELIEDLQIILSNKKINLGTDFYSVNFKLDKDGKTIDLYPEDLSHGELKRLSIYMWLKYYNIEDAIVLMDEIEIAFHPDWQYQIISDLKEWAPSNQYILATHSYELCQALTPAHVKELEPKLLKQKPSN